MWSSVARGDRCTKIDDGGVEFSNGVGGGGWWSCGARNRVRSRLVVAACSRGDLVKARWGGGEWMAAELGNAILMDELGFAGERAERIRADGLSQGRGKGRERLRGARGLVDAARSTWLTGPSGRRALLVLKRRVWREVGGSADRWVPGVGERDAVRSCQLHRERG